MTQKPEWVLVPREPTEEMLDGKARDVLLDDRMTGSGHKRPKAAILADIYDGFLAASPSPEGTRERGELVARTEALLLQVHDALEAARDKMRGACEPDDRAVYDQVNAALYALRGRPDLAAILALVSPLEGKGSSGASPSAHVANATATEAPAPSAACRTCGGTKRIHVVEGATSPAHDIDCPVCVGREIAPGVRITQSEIPR
jgi:hypothetical protein